jgi:hypothetical protein
MTRSNLSTLRWTTAFLAIAPGYATGKAIMEHVKPAASTLELAAQMAGTIVIGYGTAYILIGIVVAQFYKRTQ